MCLFAMVNEAYRKFCLDGQKSLVGTVSRKKVNYNRASCRQIIVARNRGKVIDHCWYGGERREDVKMSKEVKLDVSIKTSFI